MALRGLREFEEEGEEEVLRRLVIPKGVGGFLVWGTNQMTLGKSSIAKSQPQKKVPTPVASNVPFKGRLNQACQQKYKTSFGKGPLQSSITYTTEEAGDGFMCQLTCDQFTSIYTSEAPASGRKIAEENAAMHAVKGEFPALFKNAPMAIKKAAAELHPEPRCTRHLIAGIFKKRGIAELLGTSKTALPDAKSKLNTGITIIMGRSLIRVRGFPARGYFILGRHGAGAWWLGTIPCRRRATGSGCGWWWCAHVILSPGKETDTRQNGRAWRS